MQTFLPEGTFIKSAAALDDKRLGKQRVEAWQILRAIDDPDYGWQNHPAVIMWRPYREALICYGMAICIEWRSRGFKDTMFERFFNELDRIDWNFKTPIWYRKNYKWRLKRKLIDSHRASLVAKNPNWYRDQGWKIDEDLVKKFKKAIDNNSGLPYYWPEIKKSDKI